MNLGDYSNTLKDSVATFAACMRDFETNLALFEVSLRLNSANQLVDSSAPWKLAKDDSDRGKAQLDAVLYHLAESLRIIAILLSPVLPKAESPSAHGVSHAPAGPLIGSDQQLGCHASRLPI